MTEMRQTRRNQERLNGTDDGSYNEAIYDELGEDEIAFRFTTPNGETQLYVFLTPTVGQRRKLLGFNSEDVDPEYAQEETIRIMKELVVIPSSEEFEQMYNTLRYSKEEEFGDLFKAATEGKRKK